MQVIAYISMFIDHVCKFAFQGFSYNPLLGRLAMPIFAYLIAIGIKRTRNKHKYIFRLFLFALFSQIPFILMIFGKSNLTFSSENILQIINHYTQSFNIGFTFLIAALSIYFIDRNKSNFINVFIVLIIALFVANELKVDYGIFGVLTVYMFYYLKNKVAIFFTYLALVSGNFLYDIIKEDSTFKLMALERLKSYFSVLALPIIFWLKENKKRDNKFVHFLKYAIYPLHMIAIYLIYILV